MSAKALAPFALAGDSGNGAASYSILGIFPSGFANFASQTDLVLKIIINNYSILI